MAKKKVTEEELSPAAVAGTLTVEKWGIEQPKEYARNARKISQKAIDKVARSLQKFGWRQPIVVDNEGVVVAGHTRLRAAKKLGLKFVPVHVATDLTPEEARAYRLADNRTGEETEWDEQLLTTELQDLSAIYGELDLVTGFDMDEISKALGFEEEGDHEEPAEEEPYDAKWLILIECTGEQHQVELLERFTAEGLECKAMNG